MKGKKGRRVRRREGRGFYKFSFSFLFNREEILFRLYGEEREFRI